jgi:hypothetical protein
VLRHLSQLDPHQQLAPCSPATAKPYRLRIMSSPSVQRVSGGSRIKTVLDATAGTKTEKANGQFFYPVLVFFSSPTLIHRIRKPLAY